MTTNKPNGYWLAAVALIVVIATGGLVIWLKYQPEHPIEISFSSSQNLEGTILLGGEVNNPGLYPFTAGDSIRDLIQAAGGPKSTANLTGLKLYITPTGNPGPQKININQAETWLLQALPGIGETLAQRIVDYRGQNGPFRNTTELLKISGMGNKTYDRIKDMITIGD